MTLKVVCKWPPPYSSQYLLEEQNEWGGVSHVHGANTELAQRIVL